MFHAAFKELEEPLIEYIESLVREALRQIVLTLELNFISKTISANSKILVSLASSKMY